MKHILPMTCAAALAAVSQAQLAIDPAHEASAVLSGSTLSLQGVLTVFASDGPLRGATLTLESGGETDPCIADFNGDGFVDFFDYDAFVACFESAACPPSRTADANEDGFVDGFDYLDYIGRFELGC